MKHDVNVHDFINQGSLGSHETFVPRFSWLKKGYNLLNENGHIFQDPDAIEKLGVGKNMLRSIRFWCLAFKIAEIDSNTTGTIRPTPLGKLLLDDDGGDPYLEDLASLWLLHWQLFVPPLSFVSVPLAFNFCSLPEFSTQDFGASLIQNTLKYDKLAKLSENSKMKDASSIIRTYINTNEKTEIRSQFEDLQLITGLDHNNSYCFNLEQKNTIPPVLFLAACLSYLYHYYPYQNSISLSRLVYDINSPGVAFKLSETDCGNLLESAMGIIANISFIESTGIRQLQFHGEPQELYWTCIQVYYGDSK